MTRAGLMPIGVAKEIRALAPTWIAAAAAVSTIAVFRDVFRDPTLWALGVLPYVIGTVTLGALSIGHEYSHGTLSLLLSHPSPRRRLLLTKLAVVTPMVLSLAALEVRGAPTWAALWVPVVCGLCIAPLLTMACRGPLAGVVFTALVPGLLWFLSNSVTIARFGFLPQHARLADDFRLLVFSCAMLVVCAVTSVLTWQAFVRLEAIDGRDSDVEMPRWLRGRPVQVATSAGVRRRHPLWLLLTKEVRVQQMAFLVAAIYILAVLSMAMYQRWVLQRFADYVADVLTFMYGGLLALVIGSLASAEERHFGTLESQLLCPMAAWKQWTVKAGTALGLALLLTVALPLLVSGEPIDRRYASYALVMIVLTTGALFVSSVCTSGLGALLLSLTMAFVVPLVAAGMQWLVVRAVETLHGPGKPFALASSPLAFVLTAGFVALLLRFGHVNHRSVETGGRLWSQIGWMAGYLAVFVILFAL